MSFPAKFVAALPALLVIAPTSWTPGPALGTGPLLATTQDQRDSTRTHRRARLLQARFERLRIRELPRIPGGGSHECDEIIGRLCIWDDGDDDWKPKEEPLEIGEARSELLAGLDSLAALLPGDHWIFGQRIRYLVEAGQLGTAQAEGLRCRLPARWRCDAYLGYAHHHQAEFGRAEEVFRRAVATMPDDVREEWTSPRYVLDRELLRWRSEQPDSAAAIARLWMLADPLFLAEGNDRWTAHMSRWSYSISAQRARNPYELSWGEDLTEVVVRYGWPVAWERTWPRVGQSTFSIVGRDLPGAFRTFPPREVLGRGPSGEEPVAWDIEERHARSAYLPPYLDSLGVLDGQVGRFWRPGHVVVVGAWTAPEAGAQPGEAGARQVLSGLFVEQEGEIRGQARTSTDPGSPVRLETRVSWADWGTVSLEAWAPGARQARRLRAGMGFRQLPPDLLVVSDLMFLETGAEPGTLEEMIGVLRSSSEVQQGEALGVAMEVYGLGLRPGTVGFRAWLERRGEGLLTRVARWMKLTGPREAVSVAWEEAGRRTPEPLFRTFAIRIPELTEGEYDVVVEVSDRGRAPLRVRRSFKVL